MLGSYLQQSNFQSRGRKNTPSCLVTETLINTKWIKWSFTCEFNFAPYELKGVCFQESTTCRMCGRHLKESAMLWWSQTLTRCTRRLIWPCWIDFCDWLLITTLLITWQPRITLSSITRCVPVYLNCFHIFDSSLSKLYSPPFMSPIGHESYKLLWYHPWSSVCVIHCAVLWTGYGSSGVGFTEGQWDGRPSTNAKRLPDFPRCTDRSSTSNQIVL